jgi:hypothetical protein
MSTKSLTLKAEHAVTERIAINDAMLKLLQCLTKTKIR